MFSTMAEMIDNDMASEIEKYTVKKAAEIVNASEVTKSAQVMMDADSYQQPLPEHIRRKYGKYK